MAVSSPYLLTPICCFTSWLSPRSVLDVGCGYGTWGVLVRQFVDYPWTLESGAPRWRVRLVGVEAWEGYRNPLWGQVYDDVVVEDALSYLPRVAAGSFELALAIEVLEHLGPQEGDRLIAELQRVARHVVVTTPDRPMPQDALEDNPFEVHKSFWSWAALRRRGAVARLPASGSCVALFSQAPAEIQPWLRGLRVRVVGPLVPAGLRRFLQVVGSRLNVHPGPPSRGHGPPVQRVR